MASLDTGRTHHLGFRAFFLFLGWGSFLIVLLVAALCAWWWYGARFVPDPYVVYYDYSVKLFALLIAGYATYKLAASYFAYRAHAYRFDDEFFHLIKGYISRHEVGVVYHQIQSVTVHRSLGARLVGVADLVIITSSGGGASDAHLPGLDMRKARMVQRELLMRAKRSQHAPVQTGYQTGYQTVPFEDLDDDEDDD